MKRYLKISYKNPVYVNSAISVMRSILTRYKTGNDLEENKKAFNNYFVKAFNGNTNKFDVYISYAFACFVDASNALNGKVSMDKKYDLNIEFIDKVELEVTAIVLDIWKGILHTSEGVLL